MMKALHHVAIVAVYFVLATGALAQAPSGASIAPPAAPALINMGRIAPAYPIPYAPASVDEIKATLDRVLAYLETASPVRVIDVATGGAVTYLSQLPLRVRFERGDFSIIGYEWGVTYSGMLLAAEVTGDVRYREYTETRLSAIATVADHVRRNPPPAADNEGGPRRLAAMRPIISPRSLDDSGSMCVAMIKAHRAGLHPDALRPWIDNYMKWISTGQQRFADGTLARNRPLANSLWLDDLYMSVPALAQMGALTGARSYFDDSARQILRFAERMFVREKNLFMHGWVEGMEPHPAFHWARANGWAVVAMAELLSVLPEEHPDRGAVLGLYRAHVSGLIGAQSGQGLWHQLLDRSDSYLETSASAMFVYAIARGINRGWLDKLACGPAVAVGWNAVAQKINDKGQVEGTCVGTGMGFEPMFYYYRPTSVFAAHGYGPVLLAGAEMIALRKGAGAQAAVSDSAVQFAPSPARF